MVDEKYKSAMEIVTNLLKSNGERTRCKETSELFSNYHDVDVKECLYDIEEQFGIKIFLTSDMMYCYAVTGSPFSFTEADLKKHTSFQTNSEVYLAYIILFIFIKEMFGGENEFKRLREYITVDALCNSIDTFFTVAEDVEDIDGSVGMNFMSSAKVWNSLIVSDSDEKKEDKHTKNGFLKKTMQFYISDKAKLVIKDGPSERLHYYATRKLEDFIVNGQLNIDRFNEIMEKVMKG